MPHLLTTKHKEIITPLYYGDIVFKYIAKSKKENKILVNIKEKEFFITLKQKNQNILVKIDPNSRITPISIGKDALYAYSQVCNANILFSNIRNNNNKVKPKKEFLKDIKYFIDDFSTKKDIIIEVGFGSGKHLIYQALKHKDKIIIGVEIHTPSIEQVLKQINIQNISNIFILNYDARLFFELIKSNTVINIFVHFPVPWDKKPHRRIMNYQFIKESLRILKRNGALELRTDSIKYFNYSKKLLEDFEDFPITINKNKDLEITSKYETRWKKQEKDIWDITIISTQDDKNIDINNDFSFSNNINTSMIVLDKKPIVKTNFFVHFENIFKIDNSDILIQLTMGSFNKPINKYILIRNNTAKYFQGNPIPTSANLDAHILIKELLT